MPKRLDVYLSDNNIVKSRSLAATLIKQGSVEVNGRICTKPSFTVCDGDNVKIIGELPKYVGRGGLKLERRWLTTDCILTAPSALISVRLQVDLPIVCSRTEQQRYTL